MDNALRNVPERLRVDTSKLKDVDAKVAAARDGMQAQLSEALKKAAADQEKNMDLQRTQYEYWLKKKTDELTSFVDQFDTYKAEKTKQINTLEKNSLYLFDYSNQLATLIANFEKGNYPVYEKAGVKAIAFPHKDKPDPMLTDTIKDVLKYKKRADDFVCTRPTGLAATFTEDNPSGKPRAEAAVAAAAAPTATSVDGGAASAALERQVAALQEQLAAA